MPITAADLVAAARQHILEIDSATLAQEDPAALVLVDVREPAEFESGHLPGAVNIPRGVLEFQVEAHPAVACATDPALSVRERPLVVYCRTGGRSALAAENLQKLGFARVRSLAGGITAWRDGGHPVTTR